jgi:hypothetical protein
VIDPKSEMFPVAGAARAAGVSYAVACAWLEASRAPRALVGDEYASTRVEAAWNAGVAEFGEAAMIALHDYLVEGGRDGRIAHPSRMSAVSVLVAGGLSAEEMRLLDIWRHVDDGELGDLIARGDVSIEVRATRRRVAALRGRLRGLV